MSQEEESPFQVFPVTIHCTKTSDDQHEQETETCNYTMVERQIFLENICPREGGEGCFP